MMERLAKGIHDLGATVSPDPISLLQRMNEGDVDGVLLVTCSELGMYPLSALLPDADGLATIQNMGGTLSLEDVSGGDLASIKLMQKGGSLTDIVVCGHSPCSALNLLVFPEEWLVGELTSCAYTDAWLRSHGEFQKTLEHYYGTAGKGALMDIAAREFVLHQLEKLSSVPELDTMIRQRRLRLHGWLVTGAGLHVYTAAKQEFVQHEGLLGADHPRLRSRTARARNARA
jgi:carbonic anhydrase